MKTWIDGHGIKRQVTDVFISYSSADRTRVEALIEQLEKEDLTVFWDRHIPPGMSYRSFLKKALDNTRLVLVVWSKVSTKSEWVYSEAEFARLRKRLVSCRIDDCTPDPPFNTFETADLSDWGGDGKNDNWRKVVDLIRFRVTSSGAASPIGEVNK
jgi:TIR domain